jgi:hypothetical protein
VLLRDTNTREEEREEREKQRERREEKTLAAKPPHSAQATKSLAWEKYFGRNYTTYI